MKRVLVVTTMFIVLAGAKSWGQTLSGTYDIAGGGNDYATISAAIADINSASTITGKVTFYIQGDIANEPGGSITSSLLNSSDRVVFRPAGSTRSVLLDAPIIIKTDYVTIDGSLTEGGTGQSLKFGLNTGGDGTYLIGIEDFVTADSIKHCELGVIGNAGDYAITMDAVNTKSGLVLDSLTLAGSGKTNGVLYLNNLAGTTVISNCTINGSATSSMGATGIKVGTAAGTINIVKTKIHSLATSGGGGLLGIDNTSSSSAALNLYNNMIGGDFSASSGPSSYILMNLAGGGAKKAYHNTLVLGSISGNLGSNTGACVALIAGTLDLENNILVNHVSAGFASCIYFTTLPAALTSDYNCLYKSGTGNIGDDGLSTYSTLGGGSGWTSGTGKDGSSVSIAPSFQSSGDLHLQGPFVLGGDGDERLTGTDLTATVPDDIDGDARRTGIQGPYMGADESATPLPVQVIAITATSARLDATLTWSTASEVNNHGFEIERRRVSSSSTQASTGWEKVGFVQGAGTSTSPRSYSYIDAGLPAGRYAYRIKQIDNDGSCTYYLAAEVEVGVAEKVLALEANYPNPFNPSTNIAFTVPENGKVALRVFNLLGQEVAVLFDGVAEAGKLYQKTFDASQLPTGLYFSRLEFGGKSLMRKMLFVK